MSAPWLVRMSSLYFHKAHTLRHMSALLRYNAHSTSSVRVQTIIRDIYFIKEIKTFSSYIVELYKHFGIF